MKVAFFSPMPPERTGVAHYASMLVPALRERMDVEVMTSDNRQPTTDNRIYQLGNNPHHAWIYREAMKTPGVIVLHDVVLHHLIVEMTLARGDAEGYVEAMRANHGEMGAASARGRIAGLHDEIANFLMPASIDIANRSRAVIVHNRWAAERLQSFGVRTPIFVVPHPYRPRATSSVPGPRSSVGFFGFMTSAKRAEVVLEAFRVARARDPRVRLLIVGEAAPNIQVPRGEGITVAGYVADDEFDAYYDKVDRLVNLRYPSAGETSGTLIRAFDAGKPVAVSDYAQFAELPDDVVTKIPFGPDEVERLAEFFVRALPPVAGAQRRWLEQNARIDLTVEGYLEAIHSDGKRSESSGVAAALQIFPKVSVRWDGETLTLRNEGETTIRAGEYGQPAYRAVIKLFDGDRQIADRWLAVPRDLAPGEEAAIALRSSATRLTLTHALQDVPLLDETPAAEVELGRVR
ncbi:MAG TPA: glycosyltransferase family 4 protein [Thermoanaerobaculia bacterium]